MYVYIIGGFLGSGKTTLIMKLASMYTKRGQKTAIVVNEAGEIGVDGATLKAEGYDAIELPNGCICCTLAGTLQSALQSIKEDIDPDIILIEPTGLALPHKVKDLIHYAMIDEDDTFIVGVCDLLRFHSLIEKKENFFNLQMSKADFILLNKADLATPEQIEEVKTWINNKYPGKKTITISAKEDENMDEVYELMR